MKRSTPTQLAAIIAAAGLSRRMGEPKQLLPWDGRTVIETVIQNLAAGGADPVLCVVGHQAERVSAAVQGTDARILHNDGYRQYDLLSSYQTGIEWLNANTDAEIAGALLALGDQPHVRPDVIGQIVAQATETPHAIVVPSHNMRRGHPVILPRQLWPDLLELANDDSLRTLINRHDNNILYVNIKQDSILHDIDTPEEYARLKAACGREEQPKT